MAEKTNRKSGRGSGYYQAQFHRTTANKARRAAKRAKLASLRRAAQRGARWATKYVANLTRRIRQLDAKRPDHATKIASHTARITGLRQQFSLP